jgi:hypothetical protein
VFKNGCLPEPPLFSSTKLPPTGILFMPIDSTENRLFDAIDGNSFVKNSPCSPQKSQLDMARTFFERLWWYDQVVFDASRAT